MTDFNTLKLSQPLLQALADEGYTQPTPIQTQAIPPALEGRDILGIAQTGTGKTAAFALPILNHLAANPVQLRSKSTRVLILAPTRELASQIAASFRTYGQHMKVSVATVFGGIPINRQIREMQRGVDVLVATPGRLIDLIQQKALSLSDVEVLVLDEADQMLDMGFIHSLRKIVPLVPKKRQTLFFSATMPKAIAELASQFIKDPVKVSVAPAATTAERVDQVAVHVNQSEKQALLTLTLQDETIDRALVFTRTKHGADRVVKYLARAGIKAAAIHGNKSQPQRERTLGAFRDGSLKILVATDIAARGIDIDGVSHVINFEIPNVPEQYVHRIGRTARAGRDGIALSFVASDERPFMRDIEKVTKQRVPLAELPEGFNRSVAEINALPPVAQEDQKPQQQPRSGRGKNNRSRTQKRPAGSGNAGGQSQGRNHSRSDNRSDSRSADGTRSQQPRKAKSSRDNNRRDDWRGETVGAGANDTDNHYQKPRPRNSQQRRAKAGERRREDA
ncbi:DEAD/DEAH box helicase [Aquisalinus flavus]|uniref:DEAD-box ATP-dependent RNA helicase RhpA n=1 Tax=Aquisalinus flavus TaxID=1526572 RepID=A0A8J2V1Y1_9PROT|nr:DEAD/DEAH box helicase [Aquisalinus flavus]MBD0426759.1 DEAD/DEAH box helicase [Aquisalinus flavus]UNE46615.1 DEAD/DEAH box helicase [Aquisalinus flavus]GGC95776.1 RNA helicase [Aquisalinus flavus]